MSRYKLTLEAEQNLTSIWNYTHDTWWVDQANNYLDDLENFCNSMGQGTDIISKPLADVHPNLMLLHRNNHYIFFKKTAGSEPIVLAFLHEQMDLLVRLRKRL